MSHLDSDNLDSSSLRGRNFQFSSLQSCNFQPLLLRKSTTLLLSSRDGSPQFTSSRRSDSDCGDPENNKDGLPRSLCELAMTKGKVRIHNDRAKETYPYNDGEKEVWARNDKTKDSGWFSLSYRFFLFVIVILANLQLACARIEVNIDEGISEAFPVAVAEFEGNNIDDIELGLKLREVIVNDLDKSGIFRVIDNEAFLEIPSNAKIPVFANWRTVNANMLLTAVVNLDREKNQVAVDYRLWDPFKEREVEKGTYKIAINGWRRVSHKIANSIYKRFLGVDGYFDSRIVFISEKGDEKHKMKRLAIMDQDGANFRFLTNNDEFVLSPRFDPKSQRVIYTSYKYKNKPAKVYILDLETGEQILICDMPHMSFAPRFAPDNNHAIMSLAEKGTTSIYEIDITTGIKTRLTSAFGAIDTSPSYSPDGKKIVFNSDRGRGRTQIYIMDRDGSNISKISNGEGSYRTPVWSPNGEWIAFTKILSGSFYIGVMKPDGSDEKLLTSSWLEEAPSWAPNSRTIIFSRQKRNGRSQLYAIDINGDNERFIYSPTDASQPSWSSIYSLSKKG